VAITSFGSLLSSFSRSSGAFSLTLMHWEKGSSRSWAVASLASLLYFSSRQ